jgi:hypothetical protein
MADVSSGTAAGGEATAMAEDGVAAVTPVSESIASEPPAEEAAEVHPEKRRRVDGEASFPLVS